MITETLSTFADDPNGILLDWEKFPEERSGFNFSKLIGCYSGFSRDIYKKDKNYYFAFPAMPNWIPNLLDELNSKFKNIKYNIINDKPVYIIKRREESYWGVSEVESIFNSLKLSGSHEKDVWKEYRSPLFNVSISDNYVETCRPFLYYILHHLIRILAKPEQHVDEKYYSKTPEGSLLDFTLRCNNARKGYRSLAEINLEESDVLKLDDVDVVNYYLNVKGNHLTQTEIFMNLNWEKFCRVPKGEIVFSENRGYISRNVSGTLLFLKKNNTVILERNGCLIGASLPLRCRELKEIEDGDYAKFKVGTYITPKVNYYYNNPKVSRVIKNYVGGYIKVEITDPGKTYKSITGLDVFFAENFKRIPKTSYDVYGIK